MVKVSKFDAVDYLDSEEMMVEYLAAAVEDDNPDVFLAALADVAKDRGMAQLAKDTGLGRESLYKTLSPGAKPRFETIMKITKALGVSLSPKKERAHT
ncbi:MAG: putative addiction module antidote protein [Desulfomicrobium sp.]|nr:putative addiction module antidote protein [Desulfomicrobium sp.]